MHFPFLHSAQNITNRPTDESTGGADSMPPTVVVHQHSENTSEGSEFMDDAIRMEDVFLPRTEESVAAGTPGLLL